MKRKIIKQASQAYTLTLPIAWVRKNGLNEKSEVDVLESGRKLIVNSKEEVCGGKIKIDVNDIHSRVLYLHINSLYAKGFDEIELISSKDISSEIITCLNSLVGYALVSKKGSSYLVKDIGGGKEQDLDEIFKRVFQVILFFYEEAMKDIIGEEKETLDSLRMRDLEVNKLCLYLQRSINRMHYPDSIDGRTLFTYSFALELIGDEIYRLWRTNVEGKIKKNKASKELLELCKEGLEECFDLYYMFSSKKVEKIYDLRNKIREKSFEVINCPQEILVRHIVKIMDEAADLSHLTLMKNLVEKP